MHIDKIPDYAALHPGYKSYLTLILLPVVLFSTLST
jgi:hypothetical protein